MTNQKRIEEAKNKAVAYNLAGDAVRANESIKLANKLEGETTACRHTGFTEDGMAIFSNFVI